MSKKWLLFASLILVACASRDDRNVGGRTRSVSTVASSSEEQSIALEFAVQREQATGAGTGTLDIAVSDIGDAGIYFLPDGSEFSYSKDGNVGRSQLNLSGTAAVRQFVSGAYSVAYNDLGGTRRTLTRIVEVDFPAFPQITSPLEMELVSGDVINVGWSLERIAEGVVFDLQLTTIPDGAVAFEASGLFGFEFAIPASSLQDGRYRLEVKARRSSEGLSFTSSSAVLLDLSK